MKIGFIGLGIMGSRMARNLQKHGVELVIHNRTKDKASELLENGAAWADSPAELAAQVEILITVLAHPQAVTDMAMGDSGFLDSLRENTLWVDCSTTTTAFTRQMAAEAQKRRVKLLDAPVAGSRDQAADAALTFLVGGEAAALETCKPYLAHMGSKVVHIGEQGMGISLKLVLNHMLATSMAAFAEGMVLGEALGIPQQTLFNVLVGGPVVAPFIARKREKIEQDDYDVEFPLEWMHKDMHMVSLAAYEFGAAMPLSNMTKELYRMAMQHGLGREDFAAIYKFMAAGAAR